MSDDKTRSNANTEPQMLLESGPMLLRDFNPKGVLRFQGRKCINLSCGREIMDHWLRPADDPDLRAEYWCEKEGGTYSLGLSEAKWEVPEGFGHGI